MMMMMMMMQLQTEATLLKGLPRTKLVALGIGSAVDQTEVRDIASTPHDRNVILVPDYRPSSLSTVEEQLRNEICNGNHSRRAKLLIYVLHVLSIPYCQSWMYVGV